MSAYKTLNTCKNKGNARIWIEGAILIEHGWTPGNRFEKSIKDKVLTLIYWPAGKHRVSGYEDRPIIDLCGKWVTEFFNGAEQYTVEVKHTGIVIKPLKRRKK